MNDIMEQKRKRIEIGVKIAALLAVGLIVQPFIILAVKGLAALILGAVVSLAVINFAPWFGMKLANWRLKALKHEANQNPIETLEGQFQERQQALVAFRDNITSFHAEVQNFYSELEEHREKFPGKAQKFEEQYTKMVNLLQARGLKYKQAQKKLSEFNDVIEQKRSEWKIAQAAAKMTKAAGVGEDFISKLMTDTALDSVQTSLNTAFADLEVSLLDEAPHAAGAVTSGENQPTALLTERAGPPKLDLGFEVLEPIAATTKKQ